MKKNQGFTIIELVVVIVILGILAVTAAPKFLNLQDDARKAAAQGVVAAIRSAANLTYTKAVLAGIETLDEDNSPGLMINGSKVGTKFGYPTKEAIARHLLTLDGWSADDKNWPTIYSVEFRPDNQSGNHGNCVVTYTEASIDKNQVVTPYQVTVSALCGGL